MKQEHIRQVLREVEIDKIINGTPIRQLPEHLIDLILYFTYSYQFKNKDELRTAVNGYPLNIKKYGNSSYWDVSKVQDMSYMFDNSVFNGDISKWDVSNVTDMSQMFLQSQFQGDISRWDVSNVQDMRCMFRDSQFNGDISWWDVSNVTNMGDMFCDSKFNGDISRWTVNPLLV